MTERLYLVLEMFATLFCMFCVYGEKFRVDIKMAVILFLEVFTVEVLNTFSILYPLVPIIYFEMLVYCWIEFHKPLKEALFRFVIVAMVSCVLQVFVSIPVALLWKPQSNEENRNLLINVLFLLSSIILYYKIPIGTYINKYQKKYIVEKIVLCITGIVVIGYLLSMEKRQQGMHIPGFYFSIAVCVILFFIVLCWISMDYKLKQKEKEIQLADMYDSSFKSLIMAARKQQHDFRNHLLAMLALAQTEPTAEKILQKQQEYCDSLLKGMKKTDVLYRINAHPLAAFIYQKLLQAEQKQITVTYEIRIDQCRVGIPLYEVIEIIGILLDNALEAAQEQKGGYRKVTLHAQEQNGSVRLTVGNYTKYQNTEAFLPMLKRGASSKGANRGLGLDKVQSYCNRYGMQWNVTVNPVKEQNKQTEQEQYPKGWIQFSIVIAENPRMLKNRKARQENRKEK